jgi:hypothetical protein
MCEIKPKHTFIFRLEFFTSHDVSLKEFLDIVVEKAFAMEQLANQDARIRCHIHEAEEYKNNKENKDVILSDGDKPVGDSNHLGDSSNSTSTLGRDMDNEKVE